MSSQKVGLLSPGDMGHVVGRVISENGMPVITCLDGRSDRTRSLARKAGIEPVSTYEDLVREADLILSILVPAEAGNAAERVCRALQRTGEHVVYVDCNAVAPSTVKSIGALVESAGGRFVDAGIIGPPPRKKGTTRFYASGREAAQFEALNAYGLDVRVIGSEIGQASGMKMTYAALTKGTAALSTELLVAAWKMGLFETLKEEFLLSQRARFEVIEQWLPALPPKSRRWVGEMEEIAKTFQELNLTPKIYQGAADVYRFVGESELAEETPETRDKSRTLDQVIEILADTSEKSS
ncbi:MAG: NAD(P)-dependent oxidoreductase [Deltaproteobacteria bacterium]|nr:NAD(P)-dependent oxidoreductase [Deltaproteobacteria bacterium]MBW2154014.1 NAD(P)-dependent oxidoreductase [Deltaproteobacteria bacterium]